MSFTDIGKSCTSHEFLTSQICLLNVTRENKIIAEISEFTVKYSKILTPIFEILANSK